jgi:pyrimidine-nucleoside phosphorylase
MNLLTLLETKRDGQSLNTLQWQEFIAALTAGQLPDYQVAAFLMAIYFRSLDGAETRDLTLAMRASGDCLEWLPDPARPVVDKHSTGGVGDKVSLPLAPLLAELGFRVPMISGRGLGITGGTLDKLESIPGYCTALDAARIHRQVEDLGCVITGQTERMVPADQRLYALRDVTGTVPSIPLITASILSKKLAEGLAVLVLDVKHGAAAFMRTREQARDLAVSMVRLGQACGVNTRALLTGMDTPLGRCAGNWVEVQESVACLSGQGPADLAALVVECAAHVLVATGRTPELGAARSRARQVLLSGGPLDRWERMLRAQGAEMEIYHSLLASGGLKAEEAVVQAPRSGWVAGCDARLVGEVVRDLGGGRLTRESEVDPRVGVLDLRQAGEPVQRGELLARVRARTPGEAAAAAARLLGAFHLADAPPPPTPLVAEVITG